MNYKSIVKIASLALLALAFSQALAMENPEYMETTPEFTLVVAASCGSIEMLQDALKQGADINYFNGAFTPLRVAALSGKKEIVKELLKHKNINLDFKDAYGVTDLDMARAYGQDEIVQLIEEAKKLQEFQSTCNQRLLDTWNRNNSSNNVDLQKLLVEKRK